MAFVLDGRVLYLPSMNQKEKKCQHLFELQEASHKDVKHYLNVL
jgi:hypothetical protein